MRYQIHFTDNYGQATIEVDNDEKYSEVMQNLNNVPECEDIWVEQYNEEEGHWEV